MTCQRAVLLLLSAVFLTFGAAGQAVYTTGFEPPDFTLGDVNGQGGWGHLSNSPTGGAIEVVPAGSPPQFGTQSLAIRTRETDFFGVANHLFSPTIDPPAGENGSTVGGVVVPNPESHFAATLWYHTPPAPVVSTRGDGRIAELNPSSKGSGADVPANRYAQVRVFNNGDGRVRVEIGWYQTAADFQVATVAFLDWNAWYRFDYLIELVDGTNGPETNDRFTLQVFDMSGSLLGSACGSTWEMGWKTGGFGGGASARAINGFDFWSQTGPDGTLVGHLDDMSMTAFTPASTLAVTITGNATACSGGTTLLTANATEGATDITTYEWRDASNAVVGTDPTLQAGPGTYTVTVTDALCVQASSASFLVTEANALGVAITGASTVPAGQTTPLTANVTGGSGTISGYVWRDAANNVVGSGGTFNAGPGTYTVQANDAACGTAISAPFTVAAPAVVPVPAASELGLLALFVAVTVIAALRMR